MRTNLYHVHYDSGCAGWVFRAAFTQLGDAKQFLLKEWVENEGIYSFKIMQRGRNVHKVSARLL